MTLNIKSIRERLGLSQKYVAVSLGVKPPSVHEWETGKSNPSIENLISLCRLFDVSADELLGLESGRIPADSPVKPELIMSIRHLNDSGVEQLEKYLSFLLSREEFTQERKLG